MTKDVPFETLKGLTIRAIQNDTRRDEMLFATNDGLFRMSHHQNCCESVSIDDICGDLEDLIDSPVLLAEAVESNDPPLPRLPSEERYHGDSETWTFYKLSTLKGSVTIRWYGSSNGYYSESVDFEKID